MSRHNQDYIGNIRTFETKNFRISVDAEYDYDTDISFDDTGEVRRKLESGEFVSFQVACTVVHKPTGTELGADYLGGCIYKSIEEFQDHRQCGLQNRRRVRMEGLYQIYRKNRPYEHCLSRKDKLRKRGFATREHAESWAAANTTEPYEILKSGLCGSYFTDMIREAISQARKQVANLGSIKLRTAA